MPTIFARCQSASAPANISDADALPSFTSTTKAIFCSFPPRVTLLSCFVPSPCCCITTVLPTGKNSLARYTAPSKYPPGLFLKSRTIPLAPLATICATASFHSSWVLSPNLFNFRCATLSLISNTTLFTTIVSLVSSTLIGSSFPSLIKVNSTPVPLGPRIIPTASGTVIPSVSRSIFFASSLTCTIKSPGFTPAALAGVPSNGATTAKTFSLYPSWIPTPSKAPPKSAFASSLAFLGKYTVYGSPRAATIPAIAPSTIFWEFIAVLST